MSEPGQAAYAFGDSPFSAQGFQNRARAGGHPLESAAWMASQPVAYGVDAGSLVATDGMPITEATLDKLVPGGWKMSSVLVPIIARRPEVSVLLTLRTAHLAAHGGQIAFPGGKIEEGDATPVDTALREAREEIGLDASLAMPLALLDLHKTGTGYRILPVLALVDPAFIPVPDPGEVADVFEVPLSFLMTLANHTPHYRQFGEHRILFHAIAHGERFIWGATAAIIRNLYDRLYAMEV